MTKELSLAEIQGQLDAVTHLCAAIAATISPSAARLVIAQAESAVERAKQSDKQSPYVAGYVAAAKQILDAVRVVADAEKIQSLIW
jgi:hypothetical protein